VKIGAPVQGVVAHGRVRLIGDSFLIYLTRETSIERTGGRNPFPFPRTRGRKGQGDEGEGRVDEIKREDW